MATPESIVKAQARKVLEKAGAYFFFPAANGYGRAGIPDIIVCVNGEFLAIECKAGKNTTTALQKRELAAIERAGGRTLVLTDDPVTFEALGYILKNMEQI